MPRQSGGIYCGNVARIKTVNLQHDIVIHRLINWDLKNEYAIKLEKNYELVKLHTGHIFIRYKIKIYSLPFLHAWFWLTYPFSSINVSRYLQFSYA